MLADDLYKLNSFDRQYDSVLTLSVCETIPHLIWSAEKTFLLHQIDWNNILGIASVLSYSENNTHLDAALRIAQTCLVQSIANVNAVQKSAAAAILENLTNKPALALAIQREHLLGNYKESFPFAFKMQTIQSEIENSIILKGKLLPLNRFQKEVYKVYEENDIISISAPTSAGKSYILCAILLEELLSQRKNIVYLVPTRALISQVEFDVRDLLKKYEVQDVNVSTVPQTEIDSTKSNVFIFTQERLHWFLNDSLELQINLLIVDEAQKIEDSNRGILLQQKIEEVVTKFPTVKVYFSSPFTSNPELLLENVNSNGRKKKVDTHFVSVNQNLIFATQYPRKRDRWQLSLCLPHKHISLGYLTLKDRPTSELKKISFIAEAFPANNSGNIIYSNGAAESEETALVLFDMLTGESESPKIKELKKLVEKTIHKEYVLAKVLTKGIAFHYGNMPLLIRQEIENLFKDGHIKYLICTSTLLEGVNLPAKAIFIRHPRRGKGHPLNENDFWNLAGRAGRWGKEYSGNIICIEPNDWEIKPNPNKAKQKIQRALDIIESKSEELLAYIQNDSPRDTANTRQDLEFAFGYYYIRYIKNKLIITNEFYAKLFAEFERLRQKIVIPDYIIIRNPGISPIAQQSLYDYFESKKADMEKLIPVYPEDDNAVADYIELIGRIGKTLSNYPPQLNHSRAILLTNWMSGKPLSYLISSSYKSYQSKEKYKDKKGLPIFIREVMDNVETFVRFRFAKDSSCYVDILRYFLEINGKPELVKEIPELNLWLEFGVSQKTHISLLALGLSRNTVIELTNYITNTQMTKDESLIWLKDQNLEQLELSPVILNDIKRVL